MGIEGMDGLSLLFTAIASRELGHFVVLGRRFPNLLLRTNVSPVLLDAAEFSAACLYIVFRIHMEALDGY